MNINKSIALALLFGVSLISSPALAASAVVSPVSKPFASSTKNTRKKLVKETPVFEVASSPMSLDPIQVSETSNTLGIPVLNFAVRAKGTSMKLQKLTVRVHAFNGGADTITPAPSAIVATLKLYADGQLIGTEQVPVTAANTHAPVTFGQLAGLNLNLPIGAVRQMQVQADFNDLENSTASAVDFDNVDRIKVTYPTKEVTNGTVVTTTNGDLVKKSGEAVGPERVLITQGLSVTMLPPTTAAINNPQGQIVSRTVTIPLKVAAVGGDSYLPLNAQYLLGAVAFNNSAAFGFKLLNPDGSEFQSTGKVNVAHQLASPNTVIQSGPNGQSYRIDAGTTKDFTLTLVLSGIGGNLPNTAQVRANVALAHSYSSLSMVPPPITQTLAPVDNYSTPFYSVGLP